MKPDVVFAQSASSLVTSMALTPSTLKTLTQFLDETADCAVNSKTTTSSSVDGKTFVNLETLGAWHGGVTTVVTPIAEQQQMHDRTVVFEIPSAPSMATRAPRRKEAVSAITATTSSPRSRAGRRSAQERHAELGLSPKELSRLRMRRQRNKEAAARCRQRRVDLTNDLQGEVEQCETERKALEDEIRELVCQKEELEMLLHSHAAAACRMRPSLAPVAVVPEAVKPRRPVTLSLESTTSSKPVSASSGVAIETPSNILVSFGLEGFTPSTTTVSTITSSLFTPMLETPTAILQML
jgi:hypothetical protein